MFNAKRFQLTSTERERAEKVAQANADSAQKSYDILMTTSGVVRVEVHNPSLSPSCRIAYVMPSHAP